MFVCVAGPSGTGKSTKVEELREKLQLPVISTDAIREEICGDSADQSRNFEVFSIAFQRLEQVDGAIFDATNLTPKDRKNVLSHTNAGTKICFYTDVPMDVALERNSKRDRVVPSEAIEKQYRRYQKPTFDEGWDFIGEI